MQATCTAERHGDYKAYARSGCRCPSAKRARKRHTQEVADGTFQREHVDSTGTRRRIQALAALGWGHADICALAGVGRAQLAHWARWPKVHRDNARLISEVYDQLSMRVPADSPRTRQLRAQAKYRGWVPPLAWDDIDDPDEQPQVAPSPSGGVDVVAVDRREQGEDIALNRAERAVLRQREQARLDVIRAERERKRAAVRAAFERGMPVMDAAAFSGMDRAAVLRAYKRMREEAK